MKTGIIYYVQISAARKNAIECFFVIYSEADFQSISLVKTGLPLQQTKWPVGICEQEVEDTSASKTERVTEAEGQLFALLQVSWRRNLGKWAHHVVKNAWDIQIVHKKVVAHNLGNLCLGKKFILNRFSMSGLWREMNVC